MFNFNKKDPLHDAARSVMEANHKRRYAEKSLNESLGITQRKGLPHEAYAEYDRSLEAVTEAVLAGKPIDEALTLAELSKAKVGEYIKKAHYKGSMADFRHGMAVGNAGAFSKRPDKEKAKKQSSISAKREAGIGQAVDKLTGKARVQAVEESELEEMSRGKLTAYVRRAGSEEDKLAKQKNPTAKKLLNRVAGQHRALDRLEGKKGDYKLDEQKERIEELSKGLLKRYQNKARKSADRASAKSDREEDKAMSTDGYKYPEKQDRHLGNAKKAQDVWYKREKGMIRANQKLGSGYSDSRNPPVKIKAVNEEDLQELSKKSLRKYMRVAKPAMEKAHRDTANAEAGHHITSDPQRKADYQKVVDSSNKTFRKRLKGVITAKNKLKGEKVKVQANEQFLKLQEEIGMSLFNRFAALQNEEAMEAFVANLSQTEFEIMEQLAYSPGSPTPDIRTGLQFAKDTFAKIKGIIPKTNAARLGGNRGNRAVTPTQAATTPTPAAAASQTKEFDSHSTAAPLPKPNADGAGFNAARQAAQKPKIDFAKAYAASKRPVDAPQPAKTPEAPNTSMMKPGDAQKMMDAGKAAKEPAKFPTPPTEAPKAAPGTAPNTSFKDAAAIKNAPSPLASVASQSTPASSPTDASGNKKGPVDAAAKAGRIASVTADFNGRNKQATPNMPVAKATPKGDNGGGVSFGGKATDKPPVGYKQGAMSQSDHQGQYEESHQLQEEVDPRFLSIAETYRRMGKK